jgi:hypothetical protein
MDLADYCRQLERHLCQKNEGHLIRIVGPAFGKVCAWAERGVPLKIAFRGIDRYCERYYAKGPRRRPVRIEFCEPDILELFDDWRRAVGVMPEAGEDVGPPRKPALAAHIARVVERLVGLRPVDGAAVPAAAIDQIVRELDALGQQARRARGHDREAIVARLGSIDGDLLACAAAVLDGERSAAFRAEAEEDLGDFLQRMPPDARAKAVEAAFDRLVRERLGLPVIAYE